MPPGSRRPRITRDRSRWFDTKYGIPAIATCHPAYLLRLTGQDQVKAKREVFYDLKAAVEKCRELASDYELASPEKPDLLAMYESRRLFSPLPPAAIAARPPRKNHVRKRPIPHRI